MPQQVCRHFPSRRDPFCFVRACPVFRALFEETALHGSWFDIVLHFSLLFNTTKQHLFLLIHHPQTTSTFCCVHPSLPLPQPTLDLQDHVCPCSLALCFSALKLLLANVSLISTLQGLVCKTARSLPCCLQDFLQSQRFSELSSVFQAWQWEWSVGTVLSNLYMRWCFAALYCWSLRQALQQRSFVLLMA